MKIAIIADDLTGANDSGVQLARYGLKTSVLLDPQPTQLEDNDAVVIDTDSRSVAAEEAYRRVKVVAQMVKKYHPVIYKKIDSTLRGNIGAEIDAIYDVIQPTFVVIAPGYPQNGRTVRNGYHYLHGTLLHETEISRDPKNPVQESYIPALLANQTKRPVGLISRETLQLGFDEVKKRLEEWRFKQTPYIVFDSETEQDLQNLAQYVHDTGETVVWVGSAGLANHLPEIYHWQKPKENFIIVKNQNPVLLVVGSVSQVSRKQLNHVLALSDVQGIQLNSLQLVRGKECRLVETERALQEAKYWAEKGYHIALYTSASPTEVKQAQEEGKKRGLTPAAVSNLIGECMGFIASKLIQQCSFKGILLTGGDTARQVCNKLGVKGFALLDELETGVPIGKLISHLNLYVITKAGAFGSHHTFIRAIKRLQGVEVT
ncbi:type III effector Hrp-dependent outer protein [Caldalkalibacillus thermarum TA2.A1]|uniref:Four-carbon acid sugar kinase family protein n=1 Tax=Caldalkalibacillus thermarum (strain TA2.A1) TaxID=986075 RepID=F5L6X3_CALTT|nr:four-carbon acid sugar kinase family protein [Caldalkalibacillus thermarum]EGL82908.1 type III effector Hrp-dependent outer protein [Caldalkalibacillus thermarum TA2.A1]QZT35165.1 four-carbon acid sugar kinase family protein [Caldalkalibacillus thermarum TA2.A1]